MVLHRHDSRLLLSTLVCCIWIAPFCPLLCPWALFVWTVAVLVFLVILSMLLVFHFLFKTFELLLQMHILNQLMLSVLVFISVNRELWLSWLTKLKNTLRFLLDVFCLFMWEAWIAHECGLSELVLSWQLSLEWYDLSVLSFGRWRRKVFDVTEALWMQPCKWEIRPSHLQVKAELASSSWISLGGLTKGGVSGLFVF